MGSTRVDGQLIDGKFYLDVSIGTWTVYAVKDSKSKSTSVNATKITRYSVEIKVMISWSTGTDAEIAAIVAALDAGEITVTETGWKVGDTRDVSLSSFTAYTNDSDGKIKTTTQAAQTAQLVIMNVGGKTFNGNGDSLDGTSCHFVVGFKDNVCKSRWGLANDNTYIDSYIKTVENNVYNALPSTIKPIFKKFEVVTGTYDFSSSSQGPNVTTQQYFTSPAEKEIFGSRTKSTSNEANALSQFTWYKTAANRVHSKYSTTWWERSPYYNGSDYACHVNSDGTADYKRADENTYGVSPFGCI